MWTVRGMGFMTKVAASAASQLAYMDKVEIIRVVPKCRRSAGSGLLDKAAVMALPAKGIILSIIRGI